jgi:hypothetical protein
VYLQATDSKTTFSVAATSLSNGSGTFKATLNTPGIQALIVSDGILSGDQVVTVMPAIPNRTTLTFPTKAIYGHAFNIDVSVGMLRAGFGSRPREQ